MRAWGRGIRASDTRHQTPHRGPVAGTSGSLRPAWGVQRLLVHVLADRRGIPQANRQTKQDRFPGGGETRSSPRPHRLRLRRARATRLRLLARDSRRWLVACRNVPSCGSIFGRRDKCERGASEVYATIGVARRRRRTDWPVTEGRCRWNVTCQMFQVRKPS